MASRTARLVKNMPAGRLLLMPLRLKTATSYYLPKSRMILEWLFSSREHTNHTYNLTDTNRKYLEHTLSLVTGATVEEMAKYVQEPLNDRALTDFVRQTARRKDAQVTDDACRFGRRLGWYALVRYCRPKLVVETGVDKGLGSVLLCSAVMKNTQEGFPGEYIGTDINPSAGSLLQPPYSKFGKIMYGDSIESLMKLDKPIDLFVNDSDHSADYEYREYKTIASNLSSQAILIGDNSHLTDKLMHFSRETGRDFLFFKEDPDRHWYPGGGIGFSFHRHC